MKVGEKKAYIYMPELGFFKGEGTTEEIMTRIKRAETKKENMSAMELRKLRKEYPGREISKLGSMWQIGPEQE